MSIDRGPQRRAGAPDRGGFPEILLGVLLVLAASVFGCSRDPRPAAGGGEAARPVVAQSAPPPPAGPRPIRVIVPRETPRSPFFLGLKAAALDDEACEVKLEVSSRIGGPTTVEFSIPEGAVISEGQRIQEVNLEVGEVQEFRVVVKVPRGSHEFVAAYATVEGRRGEAFVEFGEPPSAEERGFEIRARDVGQRIIRIGPDEKSK